MSGDSQAFQECPECFPVEALCQIDEDIVEVYVLLKAFLLECFTEGTKFKWHSEPLAVFFLISGAWELPTHGSSQQCLSSCHNVLCCIYLLKREINVPHKNVVALPFPSKCLLGYHTMHLNSGNSLAGRLSRPNAFPELVCVIAFSISSRDGCWSRPFRVD